MSSWRLILALVISTLVTCLMFAEALVVRPNFYSACISLTQSNSKKSVLLATILTHIFCARKLLMRIFYGELRAVEEQHTGEKLWYSGTEILFAIAVFHKELSQVHYASIFTFVWLVKSLHWVAEDRVDLLFTTGESDWAHVRYLSTLTVLCATDVYLLNSFYPHIDFDFSKFSTGVEQGIWVILALEIGLVLNSIALCHNKYLISMRERYFCARTPTTRPGPTRRTGCLPPRLRQTSSRSPCSVSSLFSSRRPTACPSSSSETPWSPCSILFHVSRATTTTEFLPGKSTPSPLRPVKTIWPETRRASSALKTWSSWRSPSNWCLKSCRAVTCSTTAV